MRRLSTFELLLLGMFAALVIVSHVALRFPVKAPGHSGVVWMALLVTASAVVPRPGAATTCGLISGLLAGFLGLGDKGTIDIRPLEPPTLRLALEKPRDGFRSGYQEVPLPKMPGRYDDQLAELAKIIRGEMEHPYPPAHDLAVHETVLRASGMPVD